MERPTYLLRIRTAPTTLGHIPTVSEMTYFHIDSPLKLPELYIVPYLWRTSAPVTFNVFYTRQYSTSLAQILVDSIVKQLPIN